MITSVTTTTVSTVTTLAFAGSLALVSILTLLALLVQKELTSASTSRPARVLSRVLTIGIVPLLVVFVSIVAVKVVEALQ